jgi:hypothetical protein
MQYENFRIEAWNAINKVENLQDIPKWKTDNVESQVTAFETAKIKK